MTADLPCSTRMLASVTSAAEAWIVLAAGADIVDLKDPSRGALGALSDAAVRDIVRAIGGRATVSATVGDLASMGSGEVSDAVLRMARAGVDVVKVGFFPAPSAVECVAALGDVAEQGVRIVAVLFADRLPDWSLLPRFAAAGFLGVMLDTAGKDGRSLRRHLSDSELREFIAQARRLGLVAGLAGSLTVAEIEPLLPLRPDYLGFRGALCGGGSRTASIDAAACARVRAAIPTDAAWRQGVIPQRALP